MRLFKNYYTKKMTQLNMTKSENGYRLSLNYTPLGVKLDAAQDALDAQVWKDVQRYMPVDTGALKEQTNALNMTERGRVYMYPPESDYGHYQYEGILYVDPVTGKGAFYSPEYGFWSRPKATYGDQAQKIPSDRKLTYSQPLATDHWGETAYSNHKDEWLEVVRRALK